MKVLKAHADKPEKFTARALHNIYKDKTASQRFIDHQLGVGDICIKLEQLYSESCHLLTKSRLTKYDYLPEQLPDGFMYLKDTSKPKSKRTNYFLEYLEEDVPFWVYRNRVKQYVEYADSDDWQDATGVELPTILMICESTSLQRRMVRFLNRYLENVYEEITFMLTDIEGLKGSEDSKTKLWRLIDAEDLDEMKIVSLS
jgi:hypothetical protein